MFDFITDEINLMSATVHHMMNPCFHSPPDDIT